MNNLHSTGQFMIRRQYTYGAGSVSKKKFSQKPSERKRLQQNQSACKRKEDQRYFKDLGLQGLSEALDSKSSFVRRLIWGSLWLVLMVCCVTQCTYCLIIYISGPTNVNVRIRSQKVVTPPCVTLCTADDLGRLPAVWPPTLRRGFGDIVYKDTQELLNKTGMNVSTLWNISKLGLNNLTYTIDTWSISEILEIKDPPWVEKKELNTIVGVCFTFKSLIELPCTGKEAYLAISAIGELPNTTYNDFAVIFHTEDQIPQMRYYGPLSHGIYMPLGKMTTVNMKVSMVEHVNSWNKPCLSEKDYYQCQADCFDNLIRSQSVRKNSCRLPFMKDDESLKPCSTIEEYQEMHMAFKVASGKMMEPDTHCKCYQACNKIIYSEEYILTDTSHKLLQLWISFPKCHIQVITEEYSYFIENFISDIGGALGLYVGMSLLSIVSILETLLSKTCRRVHC